jgi:hypothetical protein
MKLLYQVRDVFRKRHVSPGELRNKLAAGSQFVRTVLEGNKLFLIGEE